MSFLTETRPYRPCVGVALFNGAGKVFVGERIDTPGAWQMPQGGVDGDETIEQSVFRELHEEIGTNEAEIMKIAEETLRYDLPEDMRETLWNGRFAGQEQTWVAMRFLGRDSDIRIDAHERPEFRAWQWVSLHETLELIVPFKRDTYRRVIKMFSEFAGD